MVSDSAPRQTVTELHKVLPYPTDIDKMRRLALLTVGFVLAFWLIAANGGRINVDTPITVVAAGDPVLLLPVSPAVDRIVDDLRVELERMGSAASDPRIAEALSQIADDDDLLRAIATSPVEMFDSGRAAATATPVYDVTLEPEGVTVVVATVELIPGYGATAISREHEDGHALINRRVAARCAQEAMVAALGEGRQGEALIKGLIAHLSRASEAVHRRYHEYVAAAGLGTHLREAERALADVPGC